jgi:hypothetical protein
MKALNRDDVIVQAIESIKQGHFKGTAVKVELEAQFNRRDHGRYSSGDDEWEYCEYCDEGSVTCSTCDGGYEDGDFTCLDCEGDGQNLRYEWRQWRDRRDSARDNGTEFTEPEPAQYDECENCNGSGNVDYCPDCEEGSNTCSECEGQYRWRPDDYSEDNEDTSDTPNWNKESVCHSFIMKKLKELGLAEFKAGDWRNTHAGYSTQWHPIAPLKYAEFYRDGSVDSEFTFTLSIEDPKSVFLLPKVIDIWKQLGDAIGGGIDVHRAGMHTAILQDPNCKYPVPHTQEQQAMFINFQKSMNLFLPALFFLGSGNNRSRELGFRKPQVSSNEKYSAVYYRGQALEYRLFNTCYDNPDTILDNLVVIANTLKYWGPEYRPSGLSKVANGIRFGNEADDSLERFYCTAAHIDLLNAGLKKLKPSYYTIKDVKKQRAFNRTKRTVKHVLVERAKKATQEYKDYENRVEWEAEANRLAVQADRFQRAFYNVAPHGFTPEQRQAALQEAIAQAEAEANRIRGNKKSVQRFVEEVLQNYERNIVGQYTLQEGDNPPTPEVTINYGTWSVDHMVNIFGTTSVGGNL